MSRGAIASRRVCLVLQSGIGDVVHGLPLVNALKRDDPGRRITWVVEPLPSRLLDHHPAVDEVVRYDRRGGAAAIRRLWRELRAGRRSFDVVLNCGIYFKSAVPTLIARAPHKIGFGRDRAKDGTWLFANHRVPARGSRHRQEMYLELVEYLGVPTRPLEWRITLSEEERAAQREFFTGLGSGRVAGLLTTPALAHKDWPTDRFARVATALERDFGFRVVLLGGPGEREVARARRVAELTEARTVWALGDDLRRLIWLIDGCDLVIGPDTGPLHIARALETPVIGLYGHTDPRRAGPYGAYEDLVIDRYNYDAPGRPYSGPVEEIHPARPGYRLGRMALITVDDVLEKVERAVERYLGGGAAAPGSAPC
jgi:heptosyltransferase I